MGHVLLLERGVPGERYFLGGDNWEWRLVQRTRSYLAGLPGPFVTATHTAAEMKAVARLTGRRPASTRAEARTMGRYY